MQDICKILVFIAVINIITETKVQQTWARTNDRDNNGNLAHSLLHLLSSR